VAGLVDRSDHERAVVEEQLVLRRELKWTPLGLRPARVAAWPNRNAPVHAWQTLAAIGAAGWMDSVLKVQQKV